MTTTTGLAARTLALKEWGAVAHALLDGRQTLLLRKGGIHEKAFAVRGEGGGFVVFPTVAHSHRERVRPEHHDVLARGEADVRPGEVTVRCGLTIVDAVEVTRPEGLEAIADLHIWTAASIRSDRLEFRPRHPLHALVVRAVALPRPRTLERAEEYGGCRSWLDLPLPWDAEAVAAVHGDERLAADARRVREAVA